MRTLNHIRRAMRLCVATCLIALATGVSAETMHYSGQVFFCTPTCNSFGALGGATGGSDNTSNSVVVGTIELPEQGPGSFSFVPADNTPFEFTITTDAIPLEDPVIGPAADCSPPNQAGQLCNPATVNPLPLTNSVATVSGSGIVGPDGQFESGVLTFVFTVAPFVNNGAVITFDLSDGSAIGTVFGGAVQFIRISGSFAPANDADGDGIDDSFDNCILNANSDQRDSNGDGFGNSCDADLNDDCVINAIDLGLFRTLFFGSDPDGDFNGDGIVSTVDLGILRVTFFNAPGPSGILNDCP